MFGVSVFTVVACEEEMVFESTYPKEVSSNEDGKPGLSNSNQSPWSPEDGDEAPTVTVTVSDDTEDVYIDSLQITNLENVESVIVTIVDSEGTQVQ
jgi:hypothetical protein